MTAAMPRHPECEIMDEPEAAEAYATSDFSEVNGKFVDALFDLVGPLAKAKAVDLGTGPGDIAIRVARARPGWRVVAVDASAAMLQHARQAADAAHLTRPIEWLLADAKHTGLEPHAFDAVFSNSILHHINDTGAFWAEVKRIGRLGAFVLMRDLTRPGSPEAARSIVETYAKDGPALMQRDYYNSLLAAYTVEEVRGQIERAGIDADVEVKMVSDRHWDVVGRLPRRPR